MGDALGGHSVALGMGAGGFAIRGAAGDALETIGKKADELLGGLKQLANKEVGAQVVAKEASNKIPDLVEGSGSLVGASRAVIDPRKLTDYALNPAHPVGGNKARVFESSLGFNAKNADELMVQLRQGLTKNTPVPGKVDQFGSRFTVDIPVVGPRGSGVVRSGWIYKPGSDTPELTTLFVK